MNLKRVSAQIRRFFKGQTLPDNLTPSEVEVFCFIMEGYTYAEIGTEIFRSSKVVSVHASNIFKKTGCKSRIELEKKYKKKYLTKKKENE